MADDQAVDADTEGEDDANGPIPDAGEIRYLNTDLDVRAARGIDLKPLVAALEARGLYALTPEYARVDADGWWLCFEAQTTFREPEPNLAVLLDAIESFDPVPAVLWRACTLRELNIGYDCGHRPWAFNQGITNATLGRMAAAGLTLRLTLYPPDEPSARRHAGAVPPGPDEPPDPL